MKTYTLPIISLTFGILVISRATVVSSEVVPPKTEAAAEQMAEVSPPAADVSSEDVCLSGPVLEAVTADLARLEKRKIEITEREVALAAIEEKLTIQMQAVEEANIALGKNIEHMKSLASDDLKHLVGMYQTMKAKQAAEIFDSMDPSFAAGFLREMNTEKAGLIMANMDPRKSYTISVIIAGRNSKYRTSSP